MPQDYNNYTSAAKALPQRLESTAPANPINRQGTATSTASSNRLYQNQMMFTDRGGVFKK